MARQVYSAEDLGDSTNGTTTPSTKVSLTFTPDANSDYLFLWSCDASMASTSVDFRVDLYDGAAAQGETRYEVSTSGTGKFHSAGGIFRHQEGASPVSRTYSIRFYAEAATNNVVVRNARLVAIKLTASDVWVEAAGPTTTTSSTYSTLATLSVTPATDGNYLCITNWQISSNSTNNSAKARLLIDGATVVDEWIGVAQNETASQQIPMVSVRQFTWDATAHTVALQHCTENSTPTITSRNMRAVAIRLDDGWVSSAYGAADTRITQVGDAAYRTMVSASVALNRQTTIFAWRSEIDTNTTAQDVLVRGACGCGTIITSTNMRMANGQRHISFGFGVITPGAFGTLASPVEYSAAVGATIGIRNTTMAILNPGDTIVCLDPSTISEADVIGTPTSASLTLVEASAAGSSSTDFLNAPVCYAYAEASVRIGAAPSAEDIRSAVWGSDAVLNNLTGSMGALLNAAGAGGNPWIATIVGSYTAEQIMRLMAAYIAGNTTGQATAPVYRSITDTKDVITGTVDANGNRIITALDLT